MSLIPALVFQATFLPFHQTSQADGAPNIPAVSPTVVQTPACRSPALLWGLHCSPQCSLRAEEQDAHTSDLQGSCAVTKAALQRQTVALQTDPRTQTKGLILHQKHLNPPHSRFLAAGPSHCRVQLRSQPDPQRAAQPTLDPNHPLRLIQALLLDHMVR